MISKPTKTQWKRIQENTGLESSSCLECQQSYAYRRQWIDML